MTRNAFRTAVVLTGLVWTAGPAAAQSGAAPARPRGDVTGFAGWYAANKHDVAAEWDGWYGRSLFGAGLFGVYWTDHHRTEVEVSGATEGSVTSTLQVRSPDNRVIFGYAREFYSVRKLSLVQSYQFRRNAWFHPSLGAGVDLDWERHRTEIPPLYDFVRTDGRTEQRLVAPPGRTKPETRFKPKLSVVGGFKAYLSDQLYCRMDVKVSGARKVDQVITRFGLGIDF